MNREDESTDKKAEPFTAATSPWIVAAVTAHSVLVGTLLGLATSPVVSVVAPILMGIGGYRLLETMASHPADASPSDRAAIVSRVARLATLWCVIAIVAIFASIAVRTGKGRLTVVESLSTERRPEDDPGVFVARRILARRLDVLELPGGQISPLASQIDSISDLSIIAHLSLEAGSVAKDLSSTDKHRFQMYSFSK